MSYWKCKGATISEDGLSITISFKDEYSCSARTMTLPAEEWKNIEIYKAAYDEPERRMWEAQKRLCDYWMSSIEVAKK